MRGGGSLVKSVRCRELKNARCRKHGELVMEEVWDTLCMGGTRTQSF